MSRFSSCFLPIDRFVQSNIIIKGFKEYGYIYEIVVVFLVEMSTFPSSLLMLGRGDLCLCERLKKKCSNIEYFYSSFTFYISRKGAG